MTEYVGVGGAWKTKAAESVGVGGAWKTAAARWVGVGGAWKVAWVALSVTASNVVGSNSGAAVSGVVTGTGANASSSGGSGNYTYLWEHVSTSSGTTPSISNATVVNPTWSVTAEDGTFSISTWRVTSSDTSYGVSATNTISVTLDWTNTT